MFSCPGIHFAFIVAGNDEANAPRKKAKKTEKRTVDEHHEVFSIHEPGRAESCWQSLKEEYATSKTKLCR